MTTYTSIHRIVKIEVGKVDQVETTGAYHIHLHITDENGSKTKFSLFADDKKSLEIKKVEDLI